MYDIIIVGGGPAGLTAALYACRANKNVIVLEKAAFGGQITFSPRVENIPGFTALTGNEFAEKLVEQVLLMGAEVEPCEVLSIEDGDVKTVVTDSGNYEGKAVIIATGAAHRKLGIDREEDFIGEGISFCAVCDGAFYTGKKVGVVGGGNSALQEALMLSDLAEEVVIFQNLDTLTGEQKLRDMVYARENITVTTGVVVSELLGDTELDGVAVRTLADDSVTIHSLDGLFVAIGLEPKNEAFANLITLNQWGYAEADESCTTKTKGVFVAGDCRSKRIRQVATAVSDGAIAALAACEYLDRA